MNDALKESIDREIAATARAETAEQQVQELQGLLTAAQGRVAYLEHHFQTTQHKAIMAAVAAHEEKNHE